MKRFLFALFIVAGSLGLKAQWVSIPDTNFVNWLDTSGFHQCLNGNQLDTTCSMVVNVTGINVNHVGIHDLTGIQYFDHITYLFAQGNHLSNLPALPPLLTSVDLLGNDLTSLPPLPSTLKSLGCRDNQLTALPSLPASLITLDCIENSITQLPALPGTLTGLYCFGNSLSVLPTLPPGLQVLWCGYNPITVLPNLPGTLIDLGCDYNALTNLPALPVSLTNLNCRVNAITNLPLLPTGLKTLSCEWNSLTALSALPPGLRFLDCSFNEIEEVYELPRTLTSFNCWHNQFNYLPELPDSLFYFNCRSNPNLTCLPQLKRIVNLEFDSVDISCLPNYGNVTNSSPLLANVPLCGLYNNTGCPSFSNVSGKVFYDANSNCLSDLTEAGCGNVKVKLYENGVMKQQAYTGGEGYYSFEVGNGTYVTKADTLSLPFTVACPATGSYTSIISPTQQLDYSNDFSLRCMQQGFDAGVTTAVRDSGLFRPANYALVKFLAGDLSSFYGAHCAAGQSGQVQVTFTGPATYQGYATGSLAPTTVTGNTITWNISDFGNTDYWTAFHIRLKIDTFAQPHQFVDFNITVSTGNGDINPGNNSLTTSIEITVPFDPNIKEVYPEGDIDASQEWLTYTIHFQNTGTAEAQHVYVDDTLDTDLDASSFQLLAYSHQPLVQIKESDVRFNFPNINLPDSNTNEPASHGYVQYKIKLKDNLPVGTTINNTAFIYFDFNAPVVTNTTSNTITTSTAVSEIRNQKSEVRLYPNPVNAQLNIQTENFNPLFITISDINGKKISEQKYAPQIDVSTLTSGIYFIELKSSDAIARKRFVKM